MKRLTTQIFCKTTVFLLIEFVILHESLKELCTKSAEPGSIILSLKKEL